MIMVKKPLLIMMLLAVFAPWAANAQNRTLVTIGDGTSTQSYPLPGWYGYQYDVFIYTPSAAPALEVDSEISSLAFDVASNSASTGAKMYIWVKDVAADYTLSAATTFNEYITDATQVYANDEFTSTLGWNTFSFGSTFSHQGGNALLVAVRSIGCSTDGGCSHNCRYTPASNTYWYKRQDNSDPGQAVSGNVTDSRANIQLDLTYTGAICFTPSGLTYTNVVENTATLSWTENGESTVWVLEYSTASDYAGATTVNVSGTPTTSLTGLSALTTYYVRVKADCGSDWLTGSFTTTAHAEAVGNAWADDFEGTSCGWDLINGTITNAWAWGTATNNGGTHALYISNNGGITNAYNTSSSAMVYATKLLNFADGKYEFSFDWNGNGESNYDYLRVALVPASVTLTAGTSYPNGFGTTSLPTGWIALDGGSKLNQVTAWQSKTATINVPAGNYYMVLAWRNDSGSGTNPPAAVDNVSINRMACPYDVTGLAVSEITTSSATLSWEGGEATQWQVAYGTSNTFEGATEDIVSAASYYMTGLQTSSIYYVKVRAYCGGEDFGAWSDVLSFATACYAITALGYTENFDSYSPASNFTPSTRELPSCWNYINECTSVDYVYFPTMSSYSSAGHLSSNYLRLNSYYSSIATDHNDPQPQYAILPEMTGLAGLQITLFAKGYTASSTFKIGTMSDPTDASTFVAITEQGLTTSYQQFEYVIPDNIQGNYLAVMIDAATPDRTPNSVYIDDIVIREVPTCLKPTELAVTGVSTNTVTLGWTNGAADQTAWQICLNGDETNLIEANSNPFTVENLNASTTYTAKVRAYCSTDDQSEWSREVRFNTVCEAISDLPWNENFDAYTGSTNSSAPDDYPNDELPICWQFLNRSNNSNTYPLVFISSNSGYPVSGNCLFFRSSSSTPLYAVLPAFEKKIADLQLTFTYRNEGILTTHGTLYVGYMTDPADATTFTTVLTCEKTTALTEMDVLFPDAPVGSYIAFKYQGYLQNNSYMSIDNVKVDVIPTCTKPTALECTATTTTTATFSWTAGADETTWQIMLNGDEENLIMAQSNPFTVEGLNHSTAYTAKVSAYCSADDQSDWSNEVSFATKCEAIVVDAANPFTEDFEGDWTPLCWESIPYIDGTTTRQWTKMTDISHIHTGAGAAFSSFYGPIFLVMPALQLGTDGNAAQLTFWSYNSYVDDYDKNSIVLLDGENEIELWSPESVVQSWKEVTIDLTAYIGQTISLAFKYVGSNAHGWYVDDVEVTMTKTFTKTIGAHSGTDGWYLIASPIGDVDATAVANLANTEDNEGFDLYRFNEAAELEWENWKSHTNDDDHYHFNLEAGRGYLYANANDVTLTFTGTPYTGSGEVTLNKSSNSQGWNLVGNPYTERAYIDRDFYVINEDRDEIVTSGERNYIEPMEGVFVQAENDEEQLVFSTTLANKTGNKGALSINVTKASHNRSGNSLIDRAVVRFGEGNTLSKFQLNPNHTKVYIPQDGKDYAIVNAGNIGEIPVCFKAGNDGIYTLSFNAKEVTFSYLHLIDNMTGTDIDLLNADPETHIAGEDMQSLNPSYTFTAKTTDYASRFRLVFASIGEDANGDNASFAFFSNGNWIIGNPSTGSGSATLQVIDVMGRVLSSETVNGSVSKAINAPAGVYMLRLINGNDVKTQKIVVR